MTIYPIAIFYYIYLKTYLQNCNV